MIPDWSRRVDLPESADPLVSELIGNEPFDEEILGNSASGGPFARRLLPGLWRTIGGIFKLASTPGRGTVLTVSLPWPARARRR